MSSGLTDFRTLSGTHRLPTRDASSAMPTRMDGAAYRKRWANDEAGEFIMSLLSPDGIPLNEERYTRERSRVIGGMPPIPWQLA